MVLETLRKVGGVTFFNEGFSEESYERIQQLITVLRSMGIKLFVLDFDKTITVFHAWSRGFRKQDQVPDVLNTEFIRRFMGSPRRWFEFRVFFHLLREAEITPAIASNGSGHFILPFMNAVFPLEGDSSWLVVTPESFERTPGTDFSKSIHLNRLFAVKEVSALQTVYLDDSEGQVTNAKNVGVVKSFHASGRHGLSIRQLLTYFEIDNTPLIPISSV